MADNAQPTTADTVRKLVELVKGLDTRDLAEIKTIGAVNDGMRALKTGVPSSEEIATGPAIAARGGDVNTQIRRASDFVPQEAMTREYEDLSRRLEGLAKSVAAQSRILGSLVDGLKKADDGDKGDEVRDEVKEEKAEVEKCLRRARLALRKAEDDSEDAEDRKEAMEKAQAAVAAATALITKAEDDVESEADEKEWMKSASALKAIRTQLRAAVAKSTGTSGGATVATETVVTKTADAGTALTRDDIAEMLKGMWETSVPDIIAKVSGASKIAEPPTFMKAATVDTLGDIATRAAVANDLGQLSDMAFAKCQSLLGRVDAASKGNGDAQTVLAAITGSEDSVKALFAPLFNQAA